MPNTFGYAGLTYNHNGHTHQSIVQLTAAASLTDIAPIITQLQSLADLLKDAMNSNETIDGYVIYNSSHVLLYSGLLDTPETGTGTIGSSNPDYESATCTIVGKGSPQSLTVPGGICLFRWVCSGTFGELTGTKQLTIAAHAPLQLIADFLNASTLLWADFYGTKGVIRPYAKMQFNAFIQRKLGG